MLVDHSVLHFCARVTRKIAADYDRYCVFPEEATAGGFPRSADDLGGMIAGAIDKKIIYRQLKIHSSETRIRGFCIPYDNHYEIYFVSGLDLDYMRYLKVKELLQIHLYEESTRTIDIVELVHNQILRASPESRDLNLGHATTSDVLGELAAMEFLFPYQRRMEHAQQPMGSDGVKALAQQYQLPPFIVQRAIHKEFMDSVAPFFGPDAPAE